MSRLDVCVGVRADVRGCRIPEVICYSKLRSLDTYSIKRQKSIDERLRNPSVSVSMVIARGARTRDTPATRESPPLSLAHTQSIYSPVKRESGTVKYSVLCVLSHNGLPLDLGH